MASLPSSASQGGAPEPASQPLPASGAQPAYAAPSLDESESEDVLDQILENYNFICHPELRLKFKHQLRNCALSLALAKPWDLRHRVRAVIKPAPETKMHKLLSKVLIVPSHGLAALYSSKIPLWFLRLQFVASMNLTTKQPALDYRITTRWSDGPRIKRKERYSIGKYALVRCKWNLDIQLPDMQGHFGGPDSQHAEAVDVDCGRMDFEITQLDLVLTSPWGAKPPARPTLNTKPLTDVTVTDTTPAPRPNGTKDTANTPAKAIAQQTQDKRSDGLTSSASAQAGKQDAAQKGTVQAASTGKSGGIGGAGAGGLGVGKMGEGVPEWLVSFLSKLSVKPPQRP